MVKYVYFVNDNCREEFFEKLRNFSNLSWKEIIKITKISRASLERYKNGKIKIPLNIFNIFIKYLPEKLRDYFLGRIKEIDSSSWLRKGGLNAYLKNIKQFEKGRKKGIEAIRKYHKIIHKKMIKELDVRFELSKEICEFVGAFIGDGCFNCYNNNLYQIEFAGDSRKDLDYYKDNIIPIITKVIPNLNPHIYYVKNKNSIRIVFYSKILFYFLKKGFGFVPGRKTHTIFIPERIINSNEKFINRTIRGIFDTDGGIFWDKRISYKTPYPRITFNTASESLFNQINHYLSKHFKIHSGKVTTRDIYYIEIYGHNQLRKWVSMIGFSNLRHLKKMPQ